MAGAPAGSDLPSRSCGNPSRVPDAAPRFCEVTRPLVAKAGGAESRLIASGAESVRQSAMVTREPFQARLRARPSLLENQLVCESRPASRAALLTKSAETSE